MKKWPPAELKKVASERLIVGLLSLQGDFAEHAESLCALRAAACLVRCAADLAQIDALIIPGGESTAIAKLTQNNSDPIFDTIKNRIIAGMPVYGTCMGSIFLAKEIIGSSQGRLGLMDIKVKRNAFGAQGNSFEMLLDVPCLGQAPFPAVFIRAPIIVSCGPNVEILSTIKEGIVMARHDNILVSAFHPEISGDLRVHEYFLKMVSERKNN
jgi:5'-phosphate synthase pdxT subunit